MFRRRDKYVIRNAGKAGVINAMVSAGIHICRAENAEGALVVYAKSRDRQKIIVLFDKLCYNYEITEGTDKASLVRFLKTRSVLVAGALLIIAMTVSIPRFLYTITLECPPYLEEEARTVLNKRGIKRGMILSEIDTLSLKEGLTAIEGVSFADTEIKGSTLKIRIKAELPKESVIDLSDGKAVLAATDAIVTRQLIFSGTAVFEAGDEVHVGDELIVPKIEVEGKEVSVPARGEIYGLIEYSATIPYNGVTVEYVKSGRSHKVRKADFLWLSGRNPFSPFERYETRTKFIVSDFLLPVKITEYVFDEIIEKRTEEPFATAKDRLEKEAMSLATSSVPDGARIFDRETIVIEAGGIYYVTATVTAEGRIDAS